jgi:ubiquinone/menaquinone biosynthesis C-methylase UbiE
VSKIDIKKAAALYNNRYDLFGNSIKTVGWGTSEDQILRFEMLFRGINPKGRTILDVGCGLGDLIDYLDKVTDGDFNYIGVDIAEKLISSAKEKYSRPNVKFYVGDVSLDLLNLVDISVLSGALSFKTTGIEEYAYDTMKRMFELSKEAGCLNFLSKYVDFETEKNQHYSPETIFSKAKEFSKKVVIYHDYPLYEFTIQLLK